MNTIKLLHYSDLLLFSIPFDFSIGIFTLNAIYLYCECNKKPTNRTSMSAITKISVPMRICKCHFLDFFISLQKNVETHNSFVIFLNTFFSCLKWKQQNVSSSYTVLCPPFVKLRKVFFYKYRCCNLDRYIFGI